MSRYRGLKERAAGYHTDRAPSGQDLSGRADNKNRYGTPRKAEEFAQATDICDPSHVERSPPFLFSGYPLK